MTVPIPYSLFPGGCQRRFDLEKLLKLREAAEVLGVQPGTIYSYHSKKIGPRYIKVGNRVRYRESDLEAWIASQTITPEKTHETHRR